MNLTLNRPLCFFDLETTGLDITNARIVEIAILKVNPDGTREMYSKRVNPGIPIPPESTMIHHISDDDIKDAPHFGSIASDVLAFFSDGDLAGFNSNKFDIPVLIEEFLRCNIDFDFETRRFVDVQTIYHKMEQRNLAAAYKFYCQKSLDNAHSAEADTTATYEVLEAQIAKYDELNGSVAILSEFSQGKNPAADFAYRLVYNEKREEIFNFGKHKGKRVCDVFAGEPGYYSWIMNGEFPLYTKKVVTRIYQKMQQEKRAQ
jgi:DNA polymerase-3 subunit epsilon